MRCTGQRCTMWTDAVWMMWIPCFIWTMEERAKMCIRDRLSLEYVKQYGEAHKELNYKQVYLLEQCVVWQR